ncbi:hypothetical protein EBX31_11475, partial [bacterium]|nr:hypothetical protein [bacterium]
MAASWGRKQFPETAATLGSSRYRVSISAQNEKKSGEGWQSSSRMMASFSTSNKAVKPLSTPCFNPWFSAAYTFFTSQLQVIPFSAS